MKKYFNLSNKYMLLYTILTLIFQISISCKKVVSYLSCKNIYLYFNKIANDEIQQYLFCIEIIALSSFLVSILRGKVPKILVTLGCIFSIFISSFLNSGLLE